MRIDIQADTEFWTDIDISRSMGDREFSGYIQEQQDWFVLYDTSRSKQNPDVVKRWRNKRTHLAVLADALVTIDRMLAEKS